MNRMEDAVSRHYSSYDVLARIRGALEQTGLDPDHVTPDDLKPVDEFHIGGAEATQALLAKLAIGSTTRVLDLGCGIGGPARLVALRFGCPVTGVDLTPDFVNCARALSQMSGMGDRVRFEVASVMDLPFDAGAFDLSLLLHVGMNIPDKSTLFREAFRVLSADGIVAVYEVMKVGEGEVSFPVPWAETADMSALASPDTYIEAASDAGFTLEDQEDRRDIALAFFARIQAQAAGATPSPLGLHVLMGPTVRQKSANMIAAIQAGTIAPVQMIFRKTLH